MSRPTPRFRNVDAESRVLHHKNNQFTEAAKASIVHPQTAVNRSNRRSRSGAFGRETMTRVLGGSVRAALLVALTATVALAQATAQITGTVKDSSGGVL